MTKIEDYVKEIPEEIRRAIRGLASDHRAAIFVALHKHGELPFSELQKILEIDKAMLSYHLGKLIESALVHHYYKHELGTEKYSFYNVTPFGQNFVETLSQFLRPQPNPIQIQESSATSEALITFGDIVAQQLDIRKTALKRILACIYLDYARRWTTHHDDWFIVCDANTDVPRLGISTHAEENTNVEKRLRQTPTI